MTFVRRLYAIGYSTISCVFLACALALSFFAIVEFWNGINPLSDEPLRLRFNTLLQSIGLLTIAVVAMELGQTIMEEEVQRKANVSAPTRVRRFLSRFMVVITVALSIESLVAIFELVHEDPEKLPHAASIAVGAAALLAAWGLFVKLNTAAEELEPEAMEKTKDEDRRMEEGS